MKGNATKQALANALKQLLQKKQITKITINDMTEACGISRMTFYYHFKDIYDLAEWTFQETLHAATADCHTRDSWQQGFLNLLEMLKANQSPLVDFNRALDGRVGDRNLLHSHFCGFCKRQDGDCKNEKQKHQQGKAARSSQLHLMRRTGFASRPVDQRAIPGLRRSCPGRMPQDESESCWKAGSS